MTRAAITALALSLAGLATAQCAAAAEFEVKMLNKGASGDFVFEPALLRVAAGDTVTFRAIDANHTVGSIRGMVPSGAQPFKSDRSKDLKVTFSTPGIYGYECFVHIHSFGMSGVIVVGDDRSNLAAARAAAAQVPEKERARLEGLLTQIGG